MAYYVAVYVVANLAVFGVISTVEQNCGGRTDREAYNGFYQTNPRLSLVMTAGLFSLAGIPRSPDSSPSSWSLLPLSMPVIG